MEVESAKRRGLEMQVATYIGSGEPPFKKSRTLLSGLVQQMTADETVSEILSSGNQQEKSVCERNGNNVKDEPASPNAVVENPLAGLPNETALRELMKRTGYMITQENGQRKYGGPPPDWNGRSTPRGAEVFVGKIPRDVFEDELVPVFEKVGRIYELRLMMDFDGKNRGYAFVMFSSKSEAKAAVKKLNNFEIRKGRMLGVCSSVDNCRLFVGGIPKNKKKEDIFTEMTKVTEGVCEVIVYPSASDKTKNRGFAFVEYDSHRAAAMARRKLIPGRIQLWGHPIAVDWAEPEQEVDEDIMQQVKVLYVRNLMLETSEDKLQHVFSQFSPGSVERVKKIRDYAFVHFTSREACIEAMEKINGSKIDEAEVEVTLAKPVDKNDHNRMAKVGAKVLAQGVTGNGETPCIVSQAIVTGQNTTGGVIVYQNGMIGATSDLTYYQPNTMSIPTPTPRVIHPTKNGRNDRSRTNVGRNSYLGYSAGKATYGRYYAKNNQDRSLEPGVSTGYDPAAMPPGSIVSATPSMVPLNGTDPHLSATLYKAAQPSLTGITTNGQAYAAAMQQMVPVLTSTPQHHAKSAEQLLEEICIRYMWGTPNYQLMTVSGADNRQLFFYKVIIPALANMYPQLPFFQANKFSVNVEEAKAYAAEHVLAQLNLQPADSSSQLMVPMTQMIQPQTPAGYQSFITQPTMQVRASPPNNPGAMATSPTTFVPVTAPSPTTGIPMTFMDPNMMQPITVMYQ